MSEDIKDILINSQKEKIKSLEKEIDHLHKELKKKRLIEEDHAKMLKESNINYWKGIEETYEKLVQKLMKKNNDLNRENELLIFHLEESKERIESLLSYGKNQ